MVQAHHFDGVSSNIFAGCCRISSNFLHQTKIIHSQRIIFVRLKAPLFPHNTLVAPQPEYYRKIFGSQLLLTVSVHNVFVVGNGYKKGVYPKIPDEYAVQM